MVQKTKTSGNNFIIFCETHFIYCMLWLLDIVKPNIYIYSIGSTFVTLYMAEPKDSIKATEYVVDLESNCPNAKGVGNGLYHKFDLPVHFQKLTKNCTYFVGVIATNLEKKLSSVEAEMEFTTLAEGMHDFREKKYLV